MAKPIDALRQKHAWIRLQLPLLPDMGGTTGGEGEGKLEERSAPLCIALWHWPTGIPGGPTEPEVFWTYWLHDEVVNAEVTRMAGLHSCQW